MQVKYKIFYGGILPGTIVEVISTKKKISDEYCCVYFGTNLGGQKLKRIIPKNILELIK